MNENTAAASPRRLVVYFHNWSGPTVLPDHMIQDDEGDRPQLVHTDQIHHPPSPPSPPDPSLLDRLLMLLGRTLLPSKASENVKEENDPAIADAHRFVTRNYRSGDQVMFVTGHSLEVSLGLISIFSLLTYQFWTADHVMKAMEILAQHLHNGTTPGEPYNPLPGAGNCAPGRRIPIYAVAAISCNGSTERICETNDELKSIFPPGIEQIISYDWSHSESRSCSTVFNLEGGIISREVSMYDSVTVHPSGRIVCYPYFPALVSIS
ncbi:unnamed protein product [Rhizoctonia solani]|uniref:Uncharacterized protein n=1 Tax=Rhizoctonia solani TaxID=456999 RepID=A0A8H2X5V2_9AGAM|nr:unnamed protein product [Rhizoctonia solani]